MELSAFLKEKGVHLFIGGVKERPIAHKMGIGFCDHNHERKISLAGFQGDGQFRQRGIFVGVKSGMESVKEDVETRRTLSV